MAMVGTMERVNLEKEIPGEYGIAIMSIEWDTRQGPFPIFAYLNVDIDDSSIKQALRVDFGKGINGDDLAQFSVDQQKFLKESWPKIVLFLGDRDTARAALEKEAFELAIAQRKALRRFSAFKPFYEKQRELAAKYSF